MQINKEAAPRNHHVDGPPRLNSSRCGRYDTPAPGLNQSLSGVVQSKQGARMSSEVAERSAPSSPELSVIEQVVMQGDLSKLDPAQRVIYYRKVCDSAGLNPFTRPFDYINLNGKLTLYAKKDCTEQLRKLNGISIEHLEGRVVDDIYIVTAIARDKHGRTDQATGAVTMGNLKGDAKANALMKAETKAKRRVTLSISGLGWCDETEVETIPGAKQIEVDLSTGEIKGERVGLPAPAAQKLSMEQVYELEMILDDCDVKYSQWVYDYVKATYKTEDLTGVPAEMFDRMKTAAMKNAQETLAKIKHEDIPESMDEVMA
jgi:hypothetical protein